MANLSKKTIDIMKVNDGLYVGMSPDGVEKITIGKEGDGWVVAVSLETNLDGFEEESEAFPSEWEAIEFARNFLFKRGLRIEFI